MDPGDDSLPLGLWRENSPVDIPDGVSEVTDGVAEVSDGAEQSGAGLPEAEPHADDLVLEDGAADDDDASTVAPSSTHISDLIEINEEIQDMGVVISAAMVQIEQTKYTTTLLKELESLLQVVGTAASYIQVCFDGDFMSADSSRVKQTREWLMQIKIGWVNVKPTVDEIIKKTAKRAIEIPVSEENAGASSSSGSNAKHVKGNDWE